MQKWEYLQLVYYGDGYDDADEQSTITIFINNSEAVSKFKLSELHIYLNKLGRDGWEMVNFTPNTEHAYPTYYFKRPIP